MEIYFYDENMRYIGHRTLNINEDIPLNSTVEVADVKEEQEAYLINGKWDVRQIIKQPVSSE